MYINLPLTLFIGFGHALATQLAQNGATVFAGCLHASRNGGLQLKRLELPNLHVLQMDVTKSDEIAECFKYVSSNLAGKGITKMFPMFMVRMLS
jgi:NAD(P)-dependent dehydrogenase (short-subunit alcohol dehydrogenase family)